MRKTRPPAGVGEEAAWRTSGVRRRKRAALAFPRGQAVPMYTADFAGRGRLLEFELVLDLIGIHGLRTDGTGEAGAGATPAAQRAARGNPPGANRAGGHFSQLVFVDHVGNTSGPDDFFPMPDICFRTMRGGVIPPRENIARPTHTCHVEKSGAW